jgi:flagellar biosynthetic protein FlhB
LGRIPDIIRGPRDLQDIFGSTFGILAGILVPIFAASVATSVAGSLAQTRFLFAPAQLTPKFERISFAKGVQKLLSPKSLVEMAKSLVKIVVILTIMWREIAPQLPQIVRLFDADLRQALGWAASLAVNVGFKAGAALLVIGIADYFYQWWSYERSIMMSKQEVRDEMKQTEGNPQIKARVRSLQRRMARMRMMQAVPQADVVVRNPTHFAVALKYDEKTGRAPFVVAKGAGNVALKIVEIAGANGVHVTENQPLAQALYRSVEIGSEIPSEFYRAVAEVLAYIYTMKRAGRI